MGKRRKAGHRKRIRKPVSQGGGPKKRKPSKKGGMQRPLKPENLIKEAVPLSGESDPERQAFDSLSLDERLLERVQQKGYTAMTEIQERTIEPLKAGHDLIGVASTGTGKTGAFLIPVIERWLNSDRSFRTMVLVPTRELAQQVQQECEDLTKGLGIRCLSVIGGTSVRDDVKRLKGEPEVLVGTPGRMLDLIDRRALDPGDFSSLILDEFDRMLDMGFSEDVLKITDSIGSREQTMLFSATENKKQKALTRKLLDDPVQVRVSTGGTPVDHIEQDIVRVDRDADKFDTLLDILGKEGIGKVLLFAETKKLVGRLAKRLCRNNVPADEIHGDRSQGYRKRALNKFRSGRVRILVATDVAARGIDVEDVTHVINYELPRDMDSYMHRIGRTGRAGKTGKALTLVD